MANDFLYAQPVKIWFGKGSLSRLDEVFAAFKVERAVLVCGRHFAAEAAALQEKLPDTVIFVDSIFPVQPKAYKQAPGTKNVDYYNQKISEMCAELGVHYINHTPLWENYQKDYYEGDGIHPIYSYYTEQYLPYIYTEVMKTVEAQELSDT